MPANLLSALKSPFKFKMFLLRKVPMAYLAGLKLEEISEEKASISIKYKYLTQNPFKSIYFACLAMAGELASGTLSLIHVSNSKAPVSMLVVKMEAEFCKKAIGKIIFTSSDGKAIMQVIEDSIRTGDGRTIATTSIGIDESGDKVAEFKITWSFKPRKKT